MIPDTALRHLRLKIVMLPKYVSRQYRQTFATFPDQAWEIFLR